MSSNPMPHDDGVEPVPTEKRIGWLRMGLIIWGMNICLPAFMLSNLIATLADFPHALVALFSAALILALLGMGTGLVGTQSRVSIALSAQYSFGTQGKILLAILLMLTSLGWFGIQLEIFAVAFGQAVHSLSNHTLLSSRLLWIILGGILMTSTATFGIKAMAKLSLWAVPLLMVLLVGPFYFDGNNISWATALVHSPRQVAPMGTLISTITGAMAAGVIFFPDITRYSKGVKDTLWGITLGMLIGFPVVLALVYYLVVASHHDDLMTLWLTRPHKIYALMMMGIILLATWTTNDSNIYSAALALNSIIPRWGRWWLTLVCGAVGTCLAIMGTLEYFSQWLLLLSITVPPIGAVLIIDQFLNRHQSLPRFRPAAWIAWLAGVIIGGLTFFQSFNITSVPTLNALLITSVVYGLLHIRPSLK